MRYPRAWYFWYLHPILPRLFAMGSRQLNFFTHSPTKCLFPFLSPSHDKVIDATKNQLFFYFLVMKDAVFGWEQRAESRDIAFEPRKHSPPRGEPKGGKDANYQHKNEANQLDGSFRSPTRQHVMSSSSACPFTGSKAVSHARNWVGSVSKSRLRSLSWPFKATP